MYTEINWIIITIVVTVLSFLMVLVPLIMVILRRKFKDTRIYTAPQNTEVYTNKPNQIVYLIEEGTGKQVNLTKSEILIGRDNENDIVLSTDPYVSRAHAKITILSENVTIYNQDSANGVLVNDRPIDSYSSLRNNDVIKIGKTKFIFRLINSTFAA